MAQGTVLLLGNYRPALSIARSLGALGYTIIVSSGGGEGCTEYSRFVQERWDHPEVEASREDFLAALLGYLSQRDDIQYVFPIAEAYVLCLADEAGRLPKDITIISPEASVIRRCADKISTLGLAAAAGVPVLPYLVGEQGQFDRLAEQVGFPMVVRPLPPRVRFGHKKAVIIDDEAMLEQFCGAWAAPGEDYLFQRRAFGSRYNVYFVAERGRLLRTLETRILRTDHQDGTGLAVEGVTCAPTQVLLDDCERLVSELDYTGVGLAQFQLDTKTGVRSLLEINPRIAGSQDIAEKSGLESSRLALALARGDQLDGAWRGAVNQPGVRYGWTYGDLRGLRSSLAKKEISVGEALVWLAKAAFAAVRIRHHMTWHLRDPLPTVMLFAEQFVGKRKRASADLNNRRVDGSGHKASV